MEVKLQLNVMLLLQALLMDVIKLQYLLALHTRLLFLRFIQESRVEFLLKLLSNIIMHVKNTKLTFERKEMRIKHLEDKKMLKSRLKREKILKITFQGNKNRSKKEKSV